MFSIVHCYALDVCICLSPCTCIYMTLCDRIYVNHRMAHFMNSEISTPLNYALYTEYADICLSSSCKDHKATLLL